MLFSLLYLCEPLLSQQYDAVSFSHLLYLLALYDNNSESATIHKNIFFVLENPTCNLLAQYNSMEGETINMQFFYKILYTKIFYMIFC